MTATDPTAADAVPVVTDEIRTEIVTVTPEIAEDWLGHNSHNRNLRQRHVEMLAGAILRDEWEFNGDAIRFASDGTLLDGQHRLWAVIEADQPITTVVITGLPRSTQETIDGGGAGAARRNLGDALTLRGEKQASTLAAGLAWFWRWQIAESPRSTLRPTLHQAISTLDEHPELRDSAAEARNVARRFRTSTGMVTAVHYVLASIDPDDAATFFDKVVSGVGLEEGSPILKLRLYLEQQSVAAAQGTRANAVVHAAMILKAWNAWRDGLHIDRLLWRAGGMNAEPFPEPH